MLISSILYLFWIIKPDVQLRFKNKFNNLYLGDYVYVPWYNHIPYSFKETTIYNIIRFGGGILIFVLIVWIVGFPIDNIIPDSWGYIDEEGDWIGYDGIIGFIVTSIITYFICTKINNRYLKFENTLYYKNGQVRYEGNYKEENKDGKWIEYHWNGEVSDQGYYKNGEKYGKWTSYYLDGKISRKENYKNGKPEGEWTFYDIDSTIKGKLTYLKGKPWDGLEVLFYENDRHSSVRNYKNGKLDGKSFKYFGNKVTEEINYKNGVLDGIWTECHPDGRKTWERVYKDGKTVSWTFFNGSKKICGEGEMSESGMDLVDGEWISCDDEELYRKDNN